MQYKVSIEDWQCDGKELFLRFNRRAELLQVFVGVARKQGLNRG
jgi:hypothetical protein